MRLLLMTISRLQLSSVEQLQAELSSVWDVEITQSQPGPMEAQVWGTRLGSCEVFGSTANREMVCSGLRSQDHWTLTPITRHCASGRFRGQRLRDGDLLLLDPGGEVFQQTMAGHVQNAISIPVDLAERIIRAEYHSEPGPMLRRWARKPDLRVTGRLERVLHTLLARGKPSTSPAGANSPELASHIIAIAQSGSAPEFLRSSAAHRRRIVTRGEALIRSRLHQPPTVTELCETTFASRRLLFYAFKELLGRSPAAHAKILRLHAARRDIIAKGPQAPIQQIASALGFSHPGQFSMDYARVFGERPSQTRRHSPRFLMANTG